MRHMYNNKFLPSTTMWRRFFFSHLSVILFTGGLPQYMLGYHTPPPPPPEQAPLDQAPPPQQTPPRAGTPGVDTPLDQAPTPASRPPRAGTPPADGYCCGQYASYWNAFLYITSIAQNEHGGFPQN